jgi:hypothetical protein
MFNGASYAISHENHVILNDVKNLTALQWDIQRGSAAPLNMTMSVAVATA